MTEAALGDPRSVGGWTGHNVLPGSPEPPDAPEFTTDVGPVLEPGATVPNLEEIFKKLSPKHAAHLTRLLVERKREPRIEKHKELDLSANTDGSGNLILMLYTCPAGGEVRLTRCDVALQSTTTYNPSAPYAAAGSYMFLARNSPAQYTTYTAAEILALWQGQVAFAPTSSAGPILPGSWQYAEKSGPLFRDGQAIFLVINGAAAIASQALTINLRFVELQA